MSDSSTLTVEAAHQLLKRFDYGATNSAPLLIDRPLTQQALRVVTTHSDYQIFGVCADSTPQGLTALRSYLVALNYEEKPNPEPVEGTVYIKFNTRTGRCYSSPYAGSHRGILVSCQSDYDYKLNEMYGHLPLDLFDSPLPQVETT